MNITHSENRMLKSFLLGFLHEIFYDLFNHKIKVNQYKFSMGNYEMDDQIIRHIIKDIIDTGDYTLEGIARYARIPYDIIYDAASGIRNHLSVTSWANIVSLYLQVKPDISQMLFNKLIEIKQQNHSAYHLLLD